MKDLLELAQFYDQHKNEDLVLCTLVRRRGSSYRDRGAKKLVSPSANAGLLSGGCLENEIEQTARGEHGPLPQIRVFNTMNDEDRLLGYQLGCAGEIEILFEKVDPTRDRGLYLAFGEGTSPAGVSVGLGPENLGVREYVSARPAESNDSLFFDAWTNPIHLTLVGCGADADPYLDLARALGWKIDFVDYRSDLAREDRFAGSVIPRHLPLSKIAESLPTGPQSAVVLMTHNYESDLNIFKDLVERPLGYLGCLGPRRRYESLKSDLQKFHEKSVPLEWEKAVVRAPPGLMSRNRTPADIAFSIVAEIQMALGPDTESK